MGTMIKFKDAAVEAIDVVESPFPETVDLWPAYGRRYTTSADAKAAWANGKDFSMAFGGGCYCSIRDTAALKGRGTRSVMIWTGLRTGVEVDL